MIDSHRDSNECLVEKVRAFQLGISFESMRVLFSLDEEYFISIFGVSSRES